LLKNALWLIDLFTPFLHIAFIRNMFLKQLMMDCVNFWKYFVDLIYFVILLWGWNRVC